MSHIAYVTPMLTSTLVKGIIVFYVIIVVFMLSLFAYVIIIKRRKKKGKSNKNSTSSAKRVKPVDEMPDPDDIIEGGIIVFNKNRSFSVFIDTGGNNYYESDLLRQDLIERGYTNLFHYNQDPLMLTVQTRVNRMDVTFEKYQTELSELLEAKQRYIDEVAFIEEKLSSDELNNDVEGRMLFRDRIEELYRLIRAHEGMIVSNRAQQDRMMSLSNNRNYPKRRQVYTLRYDYNGIDFQGVELSESEIVERAVMELTTRANAVISILRKASVPARIIEERGDVIDVLRRHSRPRSGDYIRYQDRRNSNRDDIVTTSTSKREKRRLLEGRTD